MTVCLWLLINFWIWPSSQPVRRLSQWPILERYSSNKFGFTLGYHRPSSPIDKTGSSTPFGQLSGLCWTPISQNPLLSTPKLIAKPRSSIEWLCTSCACKILSIPIHGMRVSHMSNIVTTGLSIVPPTILHFRWVWDSNPWDPLMFHFLFPLYKQTLPLINL